MNSDSASDTCSWVRQLSSITTLVAGILLRTKDDSRSFSLSEDHWEVIRSLLISRADKSRRILFVSNWCQCFSFSLSLFIFYLFFKSSSISPPYPFCLLRFCQPFSLRTLGVVARRIMKVRATSARRPASEHRCERSRRHYGTTDRNRWRLIQIRSPRGGDGVVPETAAGTTPGAGQCVAISRPGSQPALPPWILLKNVAVSIETCNQSLK